jgi:hypothetical protein
VQSDSKIGARMALRAVGRCWRDVVAQSAAHGVLLAVAQRRGFGSIEALNDCSSHERVLSAFDEAIALARRRPVVE